MSREKVLIVDDELDLLMNLEAALRTEGYTVVTASSGQQALDVAAREEPNIVLLDIMMPDIDGYEVCQRIKKNPKTMNTNVIFLSAKHLPVSKVKGLDGGGDDYLTKPFDFDELLARLRVFSRINDYSRKQSSMVEFSNAINILQMDKLLDLLERKLTDVLRADLFSIFSYNEEEETMVLLVNNHDNFNTKRGLEIKLNDSPIMAEVIRTKEIVFVNNFSESRFKSKTSREKYKDDYALALPLAIGGEVIGVLNLSGNTRGFLNIPDISYMRLAAEHIASAISNATQYHRIQELAVTDGLTNIYNHRFFYEALSAEWERIQRNKKPLTVMIADIDFFKKVNDTYGHMSGDIILREVAKILKKHVRKVDVVARYGGEEFAIILPETTKEDAAQVAERIRKDIEEHCFQGEQETIRITMSMGVQDSLSADVKKYEDLVRLSDEKLYAAKQGGRNKVVV